jgi:hypothetical protein
MIRRKDERINQEEKKTKDNRRKEKIKAKRKKTDDGKKKNLRNRALFSPEKKYHSFPLPGCALIVTLNKVTILRPPFSFLRLQYLKTKFLKVLQACYLLF